MHENHSKTSLSREEQLYHDFIRRAEDFMKIEIFRNAKECYKLALDTGVDNKYVNKQISLLDQKIKSEVKTIRIILAIAVAIIATVIWL